MEPGKIADIYKGSPITVPIRKPNLAGHVMTLVNWQADFQVIDFDPMQYIKFNLFIFNFNSYN